MSSRSYLARWFLFAAVLLLLALPVTPFLVDDDVVPAFPTTEIPNNSVLCPGGYWSVAVTSFGLHRGAFGKAKPKAKGGLDAYFAHRGEEKSIQQGEDLDLLVSPTTGERVYKWISVEEYNKRRKHYTAVRRGNCSPFAFFHPGDGALWQLGKIDLSNERALYTVEGKQVELGPGEMENGRILVMTFKEYVQYLVYGFWCFLHQDFVIFVVATHMLACVDHILDGSCLNLGALSVSGRELMWIIMLYRNTSTRIKRIMTIALAILLNILAFCFIFPFLPKRFLIRSRVMPVAREGSSNPHPVKTASNSISCVKDALKAHREDTVVEKGLCSVDLDVQLLNEVIGSGGFGVVEKAMLGDSKVAVKFVNPMANCSGDAVDAITHELKMLERIPHHDNVVHCFGQFTDKDERIGIVEELMELSMYDWINSENFREDTTMKEAIEVFIDITKGLEHLHKCGVVHYDLKPKNVLLDKHLAAKVADFGCSKIKANSYITAKLCGTIGYLAPECILSMYYNIKSRVRAEKIDVFSLGVVMWEALVGYGPRSMIGDMDFSFESSSTDSTTSCLGGKMKPSRQATETFNFGTGQLNNCLVAKFPITKKCPDELRSLVTRCMDVSNRSRPTCRTIRRNLEGMRSASWANSYICDVVG